MAQGEASEVYIKPCDLIDQEREIGFDDIKKDQFDANANLFREESSKQGYEKCDHDAGVSPCLLKGDRVLAFTSEVSRWNYFLKRQGTEWKFVTGDVVLRKDWKDTNLSLHIRWENGKFEKLRGASEHVAYTDRTFVLDRECIGPGSKVYLVGHTDCEGTVLNKRYLVTAHDVEDSEVIFEDIDARKLIRHSYGSGYVGNKILYHGWLGLTSDYRVRMYLKSLADPEMEGDVFSVVLESQQAKEFFIGQKLTLGVNLLRLAEYGVGFGSNWFVNFFRHFNSSAIITNIEIEEFKVHWIGRAANPHAEPNPFDVSDAPEPVILRDGLEDVKYLVADFQYCTTSRSLWKYRPEEDESFQPSSNVISKAKWASRWHKKLDWDRWEYPCQDNVKDKQKFLEGERTLQVMYSRSVFEVQWKNGNRTTVDANDLAPVHAGSVWSDMLRFVGGTIVTNFLNSEDKDRYGVIMKVLDDQTANVKWISIKGGDCKNTAVTEAVVPLYDLSFKSESDYLSKINQHPLVGSTTGSFKVGVVKGVDLNTGQVCIKLPNQEEIRQWPHEIVHFRCDILLCPVEGHWMSWYEHVLPSMEVHQVSPEVNDDVIDSKEDSSSLNTSAMMMENIIEETEEALRGKKKLECVDELPEDNIFALEDMLPRLKETNYRRTVDTEVEEMGNFLPDGMWVEYYSTRGDIMSAAIIGPERTIFEDFLFVFDILLLEDFPKSEPHVNFRSMGVTVLPGHFCKSGAVFLPEETRLVEEEFTFSYILNVLLEIKDFMSVPLEVIYETDTANLIGCKQEDPKELFKFVLLSLLDYAIAMIRKPPKNWDKLVLAHYSKALPRIIEKYRKGKLHMKRTTTTVKGEKGDVPAQAPEKVEMIPIPWSETYAESIQTRIKVLQKLHSSINC